MDFNSLNLHALVTNEMVSAAIEFVGSETGHWMSEEDVRNSTSKTFSPKFSLDIIWFFMARAFISGAIYQKLFGGQKILSGTLIACVAHINQRLEIGDLIVGSAHSVAQACGYDRNHPNVKGAFTRLARSFMAGAKWAVKYGL